VVEARRAPVDGSLHRGDLFGGRLDDGSHLGRLLALGDERQHFALRHKGLLD